jgi:EAL domain-containing protein (putative c-di-GMP-specific phosphodiesterase class I)
MGRSGQRRQSSPSAMMPGESGNDKFRGRKDMTLDGLISDRGLRVVLEPVISIRRKASVGRVARITGGAGPAGAASRAVAGREGLAVDFDRWYRREALTAFKSAGAPGLLFLGFETAVLDLGVAGSGHLANLVREMGLQPSDIVISIRESRVEDIAVLKDFVARHRAQGFLIALMDLGVGHSNLERVSLLRPDILKVGEGLVAELEKEFFSQEILKSLATLSKKIGALLVAEGVSTEAQALAALDNGVDMLEGSFFSHEGVAERIEELAVRHKTVSLGEVEGVTETRSGLRKPSFVHGPRVDGTDRRRNRTDARPTDSREPHRRVPVCLGPRGTARIGDAHPPRRGVQTERPVPSGAARGGSFHERIRLPFNRFICEPIPNRTLCIAGLREPVCYPLGPIPRCGKQ